MAEQSRTSIKTHKLYAFQSCCILLRFLNFKCNDENDKIPFPWFPYLRERGKKRRKKEWLLKIRRDEAPRFKAGYGVDCGKDDSSLFALSTRRSARSLNNPTRIGLNMLLFKGKYLRYKRRAIINKDKTYATMIAQNNSGLLLAFELLLILFVCLFPSL